MAINLQKNKDSIVSAWKDVLDEKTSTDWALFGYEGQTNDLTFVAKGDGGLEELQNELNSGKVQYAFARVQDPKTSLPKCVLINWQGEGAPLVRKGTCAKHIRDVSNLLKGAHVTINARNEEEVDPDMIIDKVSKSTGSAYSFKERIGDVDRQTEPVGTTYKRTIPRNEINAVERDKFWQKEEEEERKRVADERRKQEEMRAKAERERQERELENQLLERESPEKQTNVGDSKRKEAEELIAMRKFDARAVFEKNTSAGQLHSRRSSKDNHNPTGVMTEEKNKVSSPTETIKQAEPIAPVLISENNEVKKNGVIPVKEEQVIAPTEGQIISDDVYTPDFGGLNLDDDGGLKAVAIYDYQAADINEISFQPGDVITHIDLIDPGWWQGIGPDGEFGLFPANYVELLDQPE